MTTELSVQEQQQVKKSSRRGFLKWGIVGGVLAATGLQVAYRKSGNKKNVLTEITIDGPFKEYGYFRPEDLGRDDIRKIASDFKLGTLILKERKRGDLVMISFTFTGDESPSRRMKVFLTVYDKEENVIGGSENTFADPRIAEKEDEDIVISKRGIRTSAASLATNINEKYKATQIGSIKVLAFEMNDK